MAFRLFQLSKNLRFAPVQARLSRLIKGGTLIMAAVCYSAVMAGVVTIALVCQDLPDRSALWGTQRPVSVQIVDRYGRDVLVRGASDMRHVDLNQLPPVLLDAVLAIEDRRFFSHVGLDPLGIARAALVNARAGHTRQGGSTLTQQLVKNVFLTPEKTLKRKVQEAVIAVWMEHDFTKRDLLNMYLSRVYFGNGTWGVEAASQRYFNKSAQEVSTGEAALLAGLLKAPSRYNPLSDTKAAAKRTAQVLAAMAQAGTLTPQHHYHALINPIEISPPPSGKSANYFVDWIWSDLEALVGTPTQDLIVQTTLDNRAQTAADAAIRTHMEHESTLSKHAHQAALVSVDGTGAVQAMVGGVSYADSQFNRAVQAQRQPGSAFKPFVYLSAFEAGLTPWDIRADAPITLGDWTPRNFKSQYGGDMALERAFAHSINTVAVKLAEEVGRERVIETASRFGLTDLQPLRSLALGAQALTPLALTQSYIPFANWGDLSPVHGIISVSTSAGQPLYDRTLASGPIPTRVIDSRSLGHINRVMRETVTRGTGYKARLEGRDVGGKTGTTNDYRDAWFVGYVPDMVTTIWVGNDDFSPMKGVTGGSLPAAIWQDFMHAALVDTAPAQLPTSRAPLPGSNTQTLKDQALEVLFQNIENALPQNTAQNQPQNQLDTVPNLTP